VVKYEITKYMNKEGKRFIWQNSKENKMLPEIKANKTK